MVLDVLGGLTNPEPTMTSLEQANNLNLYSIATSTIPARHSTLAEGQWLLVHEHLTHAKADIFQRYGKRMNVFSIYSGSN